MSLLRLMNTNKPTIGLNLGDRRHHVYLLGASGKIIAEEVIPDTRECPRLRGQSNEQVAQQPARAGHDDRGPFASSRRDAHGLCVPVSMMNVFSG